MEKVIYKYPIEEHFNEIELPQDARIIHVDTDGFELFLWAIVTPDLPKKKVKINVLGTGWNFDDETVGEYIDTVVMRNGLVWHIFKGEIE